MRFLIPILLAASSAWGFEGLPALHAPITLVVQYENSPSPAAMIEMQKELNTLLQKAQRRVELKRREEMEGTDAEDLVLVKFRGNCRMQTAPIFLDERGPLAFTHTIDGEVLPFSEVLCDKVRVAARSAMHGGQVAEGDRLMGRAMARVLAHELYHIAAKSGKHGKDGIAKRALSGAQLIADRLDFDDHDAEFLRGKPAR